jgi:HEAT repeat protein
MKRAFCLTLIFAALTSPAYAYVDITPSIGSVIADAEAVAVVRVEKVSLEKRVVVYKKLADLKGTHTETIRHHIAEGFHPRETRAVLDWAAPGKLALCFTGGKTSLICTGEYWYECSPLPDNWWAMTTGRPELSLAYFGTPEKLRDAAKGIIAGKEVIVTAVNHGSRFGVWQYNNVAFQKVLRGKDCPVWRIKASSEMPSCAMEVGAKDSPWVVGNGAAGPEDVPNLARGLTDADPKVRAQSAADLGLVGWEARGQVPALLKALDDDDSLVRVNAARALSLIGEEKTIALTTLKDALKHVSPEVRKAAALALGDLGTDARGAVAALRDALQDADASVRWAVAESLGRIGPDAALAVPMLAELMRDKEVRTAAADALGGIGTAARGAVPLLTDALKDNDPEFRWTAAIALSRIDARSARPALPMFIEKLGSSDLRARWDALMFIAPMGAEARDAAPAVRIVVKRGNGVAAATLAAIAGPDAAEDALPVLLYVLSDEWDTCDSIAQIGPAAVPSLLKQLNDPEGKSRHLVVKALGMLAPKSDEAMLALIDATKDEDRAVRTAATTALGTTGTRGKDIVAALNDALNDEDASVRLSAALALRALRTNDPAPAVQALTELLSNKSASMRRDAANALADFGAAAKSAVTALNVSLKDADTGVRTAAARAVARITTAEANREAVTVMIEALRDKDPKARLDAARLLGAVGEDAWDAISALTEARQDESEEVRRAVAEALAKIQSR